MVNHSTVNSHDVVFQQVVKLSRHYLAAAATHGILGKSLCQYHPLPANCNIIYYRVFNRITTS